MASCRNNCILKTTKDYYYLKNSRFYRFDKNSKKLCPIRIENPTVLKSFKENIFSLEEAQTLISTYIENEIFT